jgi:nucleotide-binding universal stress UspA family protein
LSEQARMKNILVLAGGGGSDDAVFAAALGIAHPLGAHLEFLHVQVDPGEAALWQPHAEFARGPAMREVMQRLQAEYVMRTAVARDNFARFCELHEISITDQPRFDGRVSAGWREEMGEADRRLMFCARHYDLVVVGRPTGPNGLPPDLLERLLLGCGRPLLIAPPRLSDPLLGTVMVCWKETAEAARAIGAAMPLLAKAERVVLAGVEEGDPSLADGLADLSHQLTWHGVSVSAEFIPSAAGAAGEMLMATARAHDANLLVMGGYGHSRTREIVFGGFTQSVLESAEMTVFLMH